MKSNDSVEAFVSIYGRSCQQSIQESIQGISLKIARYKELIAEYEHELFGKNRPAPNEQEQALAEFREKRDLEKRLRNTDIFLRNQLITVKNLVKKFDMCRCWNHQSLAGQMAELKNRLEIACWRQGSLLECLLYEDEAATQFIEEKEYILKVLDELLPNGKIEESLMNKMDRLSRVVRSYKKKTETLQIQIEALKKQLGNKRRVPWKKRKKGKKGL